MIMRVEVIGISAKVLSYETTDSENKLEVVGLYGTKWDEADDLSICINNIVVPYIIKSGKLGVHNNEDTIIEIECTGNVADIMITGLKGLFSIPVEEAEFRVNFNLGVVNEINKQVFSR